VIARRRRFIIRVTEQRQKKGKKKKDPKKEGKEKIKKRKGKKRRKKKKENKRKRQHPMPTPSNKPEKGRLLAIAGAQKTFIKTHTKKGSRRPLLFIRVTSHTTTDSSQPGIIGLEAFRSSVSTSETPKPYRVEHHTVLNHWWHYGIRKCIPYRFSNCVAHQNCFSTYI